MRITVITTCYNGFKYMGKYFDSLEHQTFKDFDVIIVDDGSTDDTLSKLVEYKKNSTLHIKIIHNSTNQKLAYSRQIGVKAVETEWLSFCDCDDWYEYDYFEKMLDKAMQTNADMVMCHFNYAYSNGSKHFLPGLNILSDESSKREFLAYSPMSLCRFIFKRALFTDLLIPHINNAEDGALTPQLLVKSHKTSIIHEGLYNYFIRDNSMSAIPSPAVYKDFETAQHVVEQTIKNEYPDECEFLGIKIICYGAILNALKASVSKAEVEKCYTFFLERYPKWKKNRYIKSLNRSKRVFMYLLSHRMYYSLKLYALLHTKITRRKM